MINYKSPLDSVNEIKRLSAKNRKTLSTPLFFLKHRCYVPTEPQTKSDFILSALNYILVCFAMVFFVLTGNVHADHQQQTETCPHTPSDSPTDKDALIALYCATDGDNWTNHNNWLTDSDIEDWNGVTKDGDNRVTHLVLNVNGLQGEIPAELGNLVSLQELVLNVNGLQGEIPAELGALVSLQKLSLIQNQLSGSIPAELGDLTQLVGLFLWWNKLTGSIPAELGGLTKLEKLYLAQNQLSGSIPAELGGLTQLVELFLWDNKLTGTIPAELGGLTKLEYLSLSRNQLTGTIPMELGDLASLMVLNLPQNQLTGTIPMELNRLINLRVLNLSQNQLTGTIPMELGGLASLEELYLYDNMLTGTIPMELGGLTKLEQLYLYDNMLTGSIPMELGDLMRLRYLFLWDNELTGSIPTELGNLANLEELYLYDNMLTGSIPMELGDLRRLRYLSLRDNELTGSIPMELGNLASLQQLYLNNNRRLTGELPLRLMDLPLETLDIRCTGVSTPADTDFQTWLNGINFQGTCPLPPPPLPPPPLPPSLPEAPEQVMGIRVVEEVEQLLVSWNPVSGADGYKVQWKSGSQQFDSSREHTVTGDDVTSYTISGLNAGEEYLVRVIATKSGADDGTPSLEVTGTPKPPPGSFQSDGGRGCAIASDELNGSMSKSVLLNLLLVVSAPFLAAPRKRR